MASAASAATVRAARSLVTRSFKLTQTTGVSGFTYVDANGNGVFDSGETPISNVTISATINASTVTAITDVGGHYIFSNIQVGSTVIVTAPTSAIGYKLTTPNPLTVPVPTATTVQNVNFGYSPGSISGKLYTDTNKNGTLNTGEPGLSGVTVTLTAQGGGSITTTTDLSGNYSFAGITAGNYTVSAPASANGQDLETAASLPVSVAVGESKTGNNFGYVSGSISGHLYTDSNKNTALDGGEPGLSGITVTLSGPNGTVTTTTGANGFYSFSNLQAGSYTVSAPSTAAGEALETTGSLSDTLLVGQTVSDVDFGYVLGSIAGVVYSDTNHNSAYDSEPGIGGVTVTLNGPGGLTLTATSDSNGFYSFPGLVAGSYNISTPSAAGGADLETGPQTVGLPAGQAITNVDFGYVTETISGVLYNDGDQDKVFDHGEGGIGGIVVTATGPGGPYVTFTFVGGGYAFTGLQAGTYTITAPSTAAGEDLETSSPLTVTLTVGNSAANVDFGYVTGQISGTVYSDDNHNGVLDNGETGIGGVTVTANGPSGSNLIVITATDGSYTFPTLEAGTYTITTPSTAGGKDLETGPLTAVLPLGGHVTGENFGYVTGSISGTVYSDANHNGTLDGSESGIGGVTVTLNGPGGPYTTTTASDGTYSFTGLQTGSYTVTAPATAGGKDLETSGSLSANLAVGGSVIGKDFGYVLGSISGTVYADANHNSTLDSGDTGIGGVTVTLNGPGGPYTTTTASNGAYSFTGLVAGSYTVTAPSTAGGKDLETSATLSPSLSVGGSVTGQNFGYVTGSISGTVYSDANHNSTLDGSESGIGGVTVTLNGPGGPYTTTTAADGTYSFTGLVAGSYTVTAPSTASGKDLETAKNLNATLSVGGSATGNDFGYVTGSISGTVYTDANQNGSLDGGESGIGGVTVTLNGPNGTVTTTTASDGTYSFTGLTVGSYTVTVPSIASSKDLETAGTVNATLAAGDDDNGNNFGYVTGSISGTVYSDTNSNGSLDSGESGIGGVTVTLNGPNGTVTTTTASNGTYTFSGLRAGSYTITSPSTAAGENLETASSLSVSLTAGQSSTGNDFGYVFPSNASISGTVYSDANKNSVLDSGETGIGGVTVTLSGPNGTVTTTTASNGTYSFTGLPAGSYIISAPSTAGTKTLETSGSLSVTLTPGQSSTGNNFGYISTTAPAPGSISGTVYKTVTGCHGTTQTGFAGVTVTLTGPNGTTTTTTNSNGQYSFSNLVAGNYSVSVPATFGGQYVTTTNPLSVALAAGQNSPNHNFVYGPLGSICGTVYSVTTSKCGGTTQKGIANVTVTLTGPNGTVTTTTDSNGHYTFSGLPAGSYKVSVPATVNGLSLSTTSPLNITLSAGQNSCGNDFKYVCLPWTTYTQGGWGNTNGTPGRLLTSNFSTVYPGGKVVIGGTYTLTFKSAAAVQAFLPAGGTANVLNASAINPTSSHAGVIAGQLLALQLNVDFSTAGVNRAGLASLKVQSGKLAGYTVASVLTLANTVVGGSIGSLPSGVSLSDLNTVLTNINQNYDGGSSDNGYLK